VAFVTQHAKRMRRVIFSSVVCPALLHVHLSTLSLKRQDFQGGEMGDVIKHINVCFDFVYKFYLEHFSF
jgi:hypothetical protein